MYIKERFSVLLNFTNDIFLKAIRVEMQACHIDHHLQRLTVQVAIRLAVSTGNLLPIKLSLINGHNSRGLFTFYLIVCYISRFI